MDTNSSDQNGSAKPQITTQTLLDDLAKAKETLDSLQQLNEGFTTKNTSQLTLIENQIADLAKHLESIQLSVFTNQLISFIKAQPGVAEAVEASGLPIDDWIVEVATQAAQPKCDVPIKKEFYDRLAHLAEFRGVPVGTLTRGELFSEHLRRLLDGSRI